MRGVVAISPGLYDTLKFLHIVFAILWVGAGLYFQFQATRLDRLGDEARLAQFTKDVEFAGQRLLLPASILVLVFGVSMVATGPYDFSDTWILLGLAGYLATAITGSVVIGPTAGKLGAMIETEGPSTPGVAALRKRIFRVSRVDQVVLLLVIADMVYKPGS
jgi:uncharacterized membrane protein